jgi:hypothetical protein
VCWALHPWRHQNVAPMGGHGGRIGHHACVGGHMDACWASCPLDGRGGTVGIPCVHTVRAVFTSESVVRADRTIRLEFVVTSIGWEVGHGGRSGPGHRARGMGGGPGWASRSWASHPCDGRGHNWVLPCRAHWMGRGGGACMHWSWVSHPLDGNHGWVSGVPLV